MEVLIIGLGSIAVKHIEALRSLDCDIIIYALRSKINSSQVEGVRNIYDLDEISPDFAIISNPTNSHYQAIKKMAEMKIPMLVEKPVLSSLDLAQDLIELIDRNNIFTHVACNLRFHPCLKFLKNHISIVNPKINEVNVYCGSFLPEWRPNRDFRSVYSVNPQMGGGVHLDLFHEMDYTIWIFGNPNNSCGFQSNMSSLNIKAFDYANYLLVYNSFNVSIILNYFRKKAKRTIEILFENETWYIDLIKGTIKNDENEFIFNSSGYQIIDSYKEQMAFFINNLQSNKETGNSVSDSIEILKVTLKNDAIKG